MMLDYYGSVAQLEIKYSDIPSISLFTLNYLGYLGSCVLLYEY